jgi:hypothetical protein
MNGLRAFIAGSFAPKRILFASACKTLVMATRPRRSSALSFGRSRSMDEGLIIAGLMRRRKTMPPMEVKTDSGKRLLTTREMW